MKKTFFFSLRSMLLVALCCFSFNAFADEVTVYEDASTSDSYVPVYGNWADSNVRSQTVYTADVLAAVGIEAGATLNGVTYYLYTPAQEAWTSQWDMTLIESEVTTLSAGYVDITAGTKVLNGGRLDATGSTLVITFDEPYIYNGGNLVVDIHNLAGANFSNASFVAASVTGASRYGYNSISWTAVTGSITNVAPKATFDYTPGKSSCPRVENLTLVNVDAYSAELSWESDVHNYNVVVAHGTDTAYHSVISERIVLNVTPFTSYSVLVSAVCPDTDVQGEVSSARKINFTSAKTCAAPDSVWFDEATLDGHTTLHWTGDASMYFLTLKEGYDVIFSDRIGTDSLELNDLTTGRHSFSVSLSAQCGPYIYQQSDTISKTLIVEVPMLPVSAPYYESFEDITYGVPEGWDNSLGTSSSTYCFNSYSYGFIGRGLRFDSYTNPNGSTNTLISPLVSIPATGYHMSFWYKNPTGGNVVASILSEGHADVIEGTFTGVADWTEFVIDMDPYVGKGVQLMLEATSNYGPQLAFVDFDEFEIAPVPTCFPASDLTVVSELTTGTSVTLAWTAPEEGASSYEVLVLNGADTLYNGIVNETVLVLDNLESATAYSLNVSIVSVCGLLDYSRAYNTTINVATSCGTITTFPWSETFEDYETGDFSNPCWVNEHVDGNGSQIFKVYYTTYSSNGNTTKQLQLPDMTAGTITRLTLPTMDIPATGAYIFSIDVYRNTSGTSYPGEGLRILCDNDTLGFISRNYTVAYGKTVPAETAIGWYTYEFDLPAGEHQITILGESKYGAATYADNLKVEAAPTCFPATNLHVETVTTTTATLAWTPAEQGGENFAVCVVAGADTLYNGTVARTELELTNLTPATVYNLAVSITTDCGDGDMSKAYNANLTVTTQLPPLTAPWSEDFEGYSNNTVALGWDNSASTTTTLSVNPHYVWGVYTTGGNNTMRMNNFFVQTGEASVKSPNIVLPAGNAYVLEFDYAHNSTGGDMTVSISTDNGASFTALGSYKKGTGTSYSSPGTMTTESIDITAFAGETIMLQFAANANYDNGAIFIDNIHVDLMATCFPVSNIHVASESVTTTSATLAWTPAEQGGENFAVCVVAGADTLYNGTVAGNELELANLTPSTAYSLEVSVATDCGNGDMAKATTATVNFQTECGVITSDYFNGFESGSAICWDLVPGITVANTSSYAYEGSKALQFATTSAVNAVLPEVDDLNGKRLTVFYRNEGTNKTSGYFLLGYMAYEKDSLDNTVANFVPVSDTVPQAFTMTQLYADYQNVPAGARAAIHYYGATSAGWYGYIDNVSIEASPTCFEVSNIHMVDGTITTNSVTFEWTAGASETEYNVVAVVYGDTIAEATVEGTSYTLENLAHSTYYYVTLFVTSVCGADDLSETVSNTFAFTTDCGVNEIDYHNPFRVSFGYLKDTIAGQECFRGYTTGGTSAWIADYDDYEAVAKVNYAVDTVRTTATLILPTIGLKEGYSYELRYMIKGTNYETEDTLAVYLNDELLVAYNAQEIGGEWVEKIDTITGNGATEIRFDYSSFFGYAFEMSLVSVREIYEFRASTFEDVTVGEDGLYRPNQNYGPNAWHSGSQEFITYADASAWGTYYYDVVVSSLKDSTFTADYAPGYDLKAACGAAAEGDNYAVWYSNWNNPNGICVALHQPEVLTGMYVTNNTYLVSSILNGDSYAKKFEAGDWFKLTVSGYTPVVDELTGMLDFVKASSVDFMLADFTDETDYKYAVDWMWLDLSSLGEVQYLGFELSSSDNGDWGMNTPAYFCFDNLGGEAPAKKADYRHIYNTPSQLYLIGDNQGWKPAEGVEMTQTEAGVFTIENVVMPNDNNWFAFTSVLSGDWDVVNTHRYGNADTNILNNATSLVRAEQCFTLAKGTYNLTVNFNTNTAVAEEVTEPEGLNGNRVSEKAEKVLREGTIYIRKGGKTYTTVGQTINK